MSSNYLKIKFINLFKNNYLMCKTIDGDYCLFKLKNRKLSCIYLKKRDFTNSIEFLCFIDIENELIVSQENNIFILKLKDKDIYLLGRDVEISYYQNNVEYTNNSFIKNELFINTLLKKSLGVYDKNVIKTFIKKIKYNKLEVLIDLREEK